MPPSDFTFYNRQEYFGELVRSAQQAKAGDSLTVMTMVFDPMVPIIDKLVLELAAAARRSANVTLIVDAYSFLLSEQDKPGPLLLHGKIEPLELNTPFDVTYSVLDELEDAGGQYYILNQPARAFSLPFAGRSHIKLALVNDKVFVGGCNLDHPDYLDLMVSWEDTATATELRELVRLITVAGSVKQALSGADQTMALGNDLNLFVDSGRRKQSLIMQQAHKLIDEAKESVLITCQFFPGGQTAQRLLAAHKRGVAVKIYYSPPSVHGLQAPGQWFYKQRERLRLPTEFFAHELPADKPKLHAKVIATESAVLMGSHNYIQAGVSLGTAEIALHIKNAAFSKSLRHEVELLISGESTSPS